MREAIGGASTKHNNKFGALLFSVEGKYDSVMSEIFFYDETNQFIKT